MPRQKTFGTTVKTITPQSSAVQFVVNELCLVPTQCLHVLVEIFGTFNVPFSFEGGHFKKQTIDSLADRKP